MFDFLTDAARQVAQTGAATATGAPKPNRPPLAPGQQPPADFDAPGPDGASAAMGFWCDEASLPPAIPPPSKLAAMEVHGAPARPVAPLAAGSYEEAQASLRSLPPEQRQAAIERLPPEQRGLAHDALMRVRMEEEQAGDARQAERTFYARAREGTLDAETVSSTMADLPPERREEILSRMSPEARAQIGEQMARDHEADVEAGAKATAKAQADAAVLEKSVSVVERVAGTKDPDPRFLMGALKDVPPEQYQQVLAGLSEEARAAVKDLEEKKAAELVDLAHAPRGFGWERDRFSGDAQTLETGVADLPPGMRAAVLKTLAEQAEDEDSRVSEGTVETVKAAIDERNQDEADTRRRKARREKDIEDGVAAAEGAIENPAAMKKTLAGLTASEERDALERMSPEARAAAETEIEKRRERLGKAAERLAEAIKGGGTNEIEILRTMSGLSAKEADELAEIYGEKFKDGKDKPRSLRADLLADLGGDDEHKERKFVNAVLNGDEDAKDLSIDLAVKYIESEVGAVFNTDETAINELLRAHARDPEAMKEIKEAYERKYKTSLDAALQKVMDEEEAHEASAYQACDLDSANVAIMKGGDGERKAEVVDEVQEEPGGLEKLATNFNHQTGTNLSTALTELPDDKRREVYGDVKEAESDVKDKRDAKLNAALEDLKKNNPEEHKKAEQDMEKLAAELNAELNKPHVFGNNTEVTNKLVGLSPAHVAILMRKFDDQKDAYGDLEARLREKLGGKDLKVANAVLSGDTLLTAVAAVEQASDGVGTNLEAWKKGMELLKTPEERKQFKELMKKHGHDYDQLNRAENSSFDRDEMGAMAEEDEDKRAAKLAQVKASKASFGGKLNSIVEGAGDMLGDATGETEEERRERRKGMRFATKYASDTMGGATSMVGFLMHAGQDEHLDAEQSLQNDYQIALYKGMMYDENGETAEDTAHRQLRGHAETASDRFREGDFEGGLSMRSIADVDRLVDDKEEGLQNAAANVRIPKAELDKIAKIEDPKLREEARANAMKRARQRLEERQNDDAIRLGHVGGIDEIARDELSSAQDSCRVDVNKDGKVSELNELLAAGDTTIGGTGKDAAKFYTVLGDKSPEGVDALRKRFEKEHPGESFDAWVLSKASSEGEKRDFKILLEGNYARMDPDKLKELAKDSPEVLIARVKALNEAAVAGKDVSWMDPVEKAKHAAGNLAGNLMAGATSDQDEVLAKRLKAVEEMERRIQAGEKLGDDEIEELIGHTKYMAGDQKGYTDTKTMAVTKVGEGVEVAVELGATAMGQKDMGAMLGALAKSQVMEYGDGGRYGEDQKLADLGKAFMKQALGDYTRGRFGPGSMIGGVIDAGGGGVIDAATDTKNYSDMGKLAGDLIGKGTTGVSTGALGQVMKPLSESGVLGKAVAKGTETALTADYSKTGGEILGDFAKGLAKDVAGDAAEGHHKQGLAKALEDKAHREGMDPTDLAQRPAPPGWEKDPKRLQEAKDAQREQSEIEDAARDLDLSPADLDNPDNYRRAQDHARKEAQERADAAHEERRKSNEKAAKSSEFDFELRPEDIDPRPYEQHEEEPRQAPPPRPLDLRPPTAAEMASEHDEEKAAKVKVDTVGPDADEKYHVPGPEPLELRLRPPTAADMASEYDEEKARRAKVDLTPEGEAQRLGCGPEAAREAARIAEERGIPLGDAVDEVRRQRDHAADTDPEAVMEELARPPELRKVDAQAVRMVEAKLASGGSLEGGELELLLQNGVERARRGIVASGAEAGLTPEQALSGEHLGGECGPTQGRVVTALETQLRAAGGEVLSHSTDPDREEGALAPAGPKSKFEGPDAAPHHFTVVKLGDKVYLVDPTFGQFMQKDATAAEVGKRLLAAKGGADVATALGKHGYVELDQDRANAYGQAISGKAGEEFGVEDFTGESSSNRRKDGRTENQARADRRDKNLADSGHDEAADAYIEGRSGSRADEPAAPGPEARVARQGLDVVPDDFEGPLEHDSSGHPVQVRERDARRSAEQLEKLTGTKAGRDALEALEGAKTRIVFKEGGGCYFDRDRNVIVMDPSAPPDLIPGILIHEAEHAKNRESPELDPNQAADPSTFIAARLEDEGKAEAQRVLHLQESGGPEAVEAWREEGRRFLDHVQKELEGMGKTTEVAKAAALQLLQKDPDRKTYVVFQVTYDDALARLAGDADLTPEQRHALATQQATEVLARNFAGRTPSTYDDQACPPGKLPLPKLNYRDDAMYQWLRANPMHDEDDPKIVDWKRRNPLHAGDLGLM